MAFLDNIDKKIMKFGQDALQKTKDMSESMRLSASIREEEHKQRDAFCKIGELYYHNCKDQAEGEFRKHCEEITESIRRAGEYRDQLQALKRVTICSVCGAENPVNAAFCNKCGAKIEHVADVPWQEVTPEAEPGKEAGPEEKPEPETVSEEDFEEEED